MAQTSTNSQRTGETTDASAEVSARRIEQWLEQGNWEELAGRLGFDCCRTAIPPAACDAWGLEASMVEKLARLEVLAAGPGYRLLLADGVERYADLRRGILEAQKHNPAECLVWWLVSDRSISVAVACRGCEGRRFVRRMETDRRHPDPVGVQQWTQMRLEDRADADVTDPGAAIRRHLVSVLEQEGITREFFEGFRRAVETLRTEMQQGPDDETLRHEIALATLLRLVFLYLLQQRGALDGDRRFVLRHYRRARSRQRGFYRDVLRPLFFGALNTVPGERDSDAQALGKLPFLNGGLFEPIPAERGHPALDWPEEVWPEIVEGLFERFHFTVDEGGRADEHRAVDPEMLGKVFEGLMYDERRRDSGSFYTPRDVVGDVVVGALGAQVAGEANVSESAVREALATGEGDWEESAAKRIASELEGLRVLDPAVGTGAFLLEALRSIEALYDSVAPDDREERAYERRRRIIRDHLFGVDIQPTAVRICELRLWLALLSVMPDWEIDEIPPLPNLGHRIGCGNSLVAPSDVAAFEHDAAPPGGLGFGGQTEIEETHERRIRTTQRAYFRAHGRRKHELKRKLESLEQQMHRRLLEARREQLREKLDPIDRLEDSRDLFGEEVELTAAQRRSREQLEDELEVVDRAIERLERERERPVGFSYRARFGPALDQEGFDIVVTNPPWIRANRLASSKRRRLKSRYASFSNELWEGADELGIRVPFGAQVDVAALFVERSLELLREGGRLAALIPSKLFRSLHGAGFRRRLSVEGLESVRDYGDADRDMFDATVYPSVLQVRKTSAQTGHAAGRGRPGRTGAVRQPRGRSGGFETTVWRGPDRESWNSEVGDVLALGDDVAEPWTFVPPAVSEVFAAMRETATPLGRVDALQPKRGAMTGRNGVFLLDDEQARDWLGRKMQSWTQRCLSGRDVRAWTIEADRRLLWAYDDELELRDDLPDELAAYFERHESELRARADDRPQKPPWQLFRLKPGLLEPKVVWRDLAPRLEAALAPADVVPLNTVYFVPLACRGQAETLVALFNSEPMRAFAYALGERARGGWRRHFAWVMRLLPVPDRLVGALGGDAALPQPPSAFRGGAAPNGTDRRRLDRWAADLYELGDAGLETLRRWRTRGRDETAKEVA